MYLVERHQMFHTHLLFSRSRPQCLSCVRVSMRIIKSLLEYCYLSITQIQPGVQKMYYLFNYDWFVYLVFFQIR